MDNPASIPELTRLQVTIDKSHLVAIGERLYAESVELLRELVNNAYDADAARRCSRRDRCSSKRVPVRALPLNFQTNAPALKRRPTLKTLSPSAMIKKFKVGQ